MMRLPILGALILSTVKEGRSLRPGSVVRLPRPSPRGSPTSLRGSPTSLCAAPSDGVDITHLYQDLDEEATVRETQDEDFRSGFITILGDPNVGKSTLLNSVLGEKLSIVTHKAQTTRHRIRGVLTTDKFQMIYSDTPGVLQPSYKLQEGMMRSVRAAIKDADVVLVVVDPWQTGFQNEGVIEELLRREKPCIVAVNKVDALLKRERMPGAAKAGDAAECRDIEDVLAQWRTEIPGAEVMPISALEGTNTTTLLDRLAERLPLGPLLFPEESLTDRPERFFAAEIIREQILLQFVDEIPYSCEVVIEKFKEAEDLLRIEASILCARDSQKGILIGKKGAAIKQLGSEARKSLEDFFQTKVMLETRIKVSKNWRANEGTLSRLGYFDE